MSATYTVSQPKTLEMEFGLPDAGSTASAAIDQALDSCVVKMKLQDRDEAAALLRQGSSEVRGYFEYGLVRHLAEYIGALDDQVQAVYQYEDEATADDAIFGEAMPGLMHMIIWAQRKTGALNSLIAALDRTVAQGYAELMETPELVHLLDVRVVDDAEVQSRSGFGAMLTWLHHRPLLVWKR
jgi:hypothetical protein